MRVFFASHRIRLTQALALPVVLAIALTHSAWVERSRAVAVGLFVSGLALTSIAIIGRLWCAIYISGYKTRSLIAAGPYSIMRHPFYFFSLVGSVGVGLTTQTLTIPLVFLFIFALLYPMVMRREEQALLSQHGDAYQDYAARVPRFWPNLKLLAEPERYEVFPLVLRRRLSDSLWFILAVGLVKLLEALRDAGVLATLWRVY